MTSRLLGELEQQILSASDARTSACRKAELAAHWARRGRSDEARSVIAELRALNVRAGDPLLSVWIHIADGVLELTEGREGEAVGRFNRARAVAIATNAQREQSVVAAWLAYVAYTRNDFQSMVASVNAVAFLGRNADVSAGSRARMVVGQAFHYAGNYAFARAWYDAARALATDIGDDGLVSALLFNMASHHVCNYRHHTLRGQLPSVSFELLSIVTESVRNYDEMIGIESLASYEGTLLASVHLFHGRFREAYDTFLEFVDVAESQGLARMKSLYLADMALCAVRLNDVSEGRRLAEASEFALSDLVHIDDRASTHSRLGQVYRLLEDQDAASQQLMLAETQWEKHSQFQRQALVYLGQVRPLAEWLT